MEGNIWRIARESKGLTQIELAHKLGFASAQYVSNIERGVTTMARKHFKRLKKIFGPEVVNEVIEYRGEQLKENLRDCL